MYYKVLGDNCELKNELICYCKRVSRQVVEKANKDGAKTLKDIQESTAACKGNQCKELNPKGICCSGDIVKLLPEQKESCSCCG